MGAVACFSAKKSKDVLVFESVTPDPLPDVKSSPEEDSSVLSKENSRSLKSASRVVSFTTEHDDGAADTVQHFMSTLLAQNSTETTVSPAPYSPLTAFTNPSMTMQSVRSISDSKLFPGWTAEGNSNQFLGFANSYFPTSRGKTYGRDGAYTVRMSMPKKESARADFRSTGEMAMHYNKEDFNFFNEKYDMSLKEYKATGIYVKRNLEKLALDFDKLRSSIVIIEPYEHVGHNKDGNEVRSGLNISQFMKHTFGLGSILLPIWKTGILSENIAKYISQTQMIIVEGGDSATYIPSTWPDALKSEDCFDLIVDLLLERAFTRAQMYICLGHQLVATAHIHLIKRMYKRIMANDDVCYNNLRKFAKKFHKVGQSVKIIKNGEVICQGYEHPKFPVAPNEVKEVQEVKLDPYEPPEREDLAQFVEAHFQCKLSAQHRLLGSKVSMFHGDEVNEEAILFASWVYTSLADMMNHDQKLKIDLARSKDLRFLLNVPIGVEITGSTRIGDFKTEVACTQIYYRPNFPTMQLEFLVSYSTQFHPELWQRSNVFSDNREAHFTPEQYRNESHFNILLEMFSAQTASFVSFE